jgi:hypothetical protein
VHCKVETAVFDDELPEVAKAAGSSSVQFISFSRIKLSSVTPAHGDYYFRKLRCFID